MGRPNSGKTAKAIDIFNTNPNGIFFTQNHPKEIIIPKVNQEYQKYIYDNCKSTDEIIGKISNINSKINFIVLDYLQLFNAINIDEIIDLLDSKEIKLILVAHIDRQGEIRCSNNNIKDILFFHKINMEKDSINKINL
jgi:hypothetical protein